MTPTRLLLSLALAFCTGCATTKQRPIKPAASPSVSTINEWGEVWRTYVSPDGYPIYEYVGMLADHITAPDFDGVLTEAGVRAAAAPHAPYWITP